MRCSSGWRIRHAAIAATPRAVWLLDAALVAAAVATYLLAARLPAVAAPFGFHPLVLVALFTVTERCLVDVQFRREAHAYSISDLVVVLGLFFSPPAAVPVARLLGAVLALPGTRNSNPAKTLFNLSVVVVETSLAALAFHAIAGLAAPGSVLSWLAALPATLLASTVSALAVSFAISLAGAAVGVRHLLSIVGLALVGTGTNSLIGLTGVRLVWHDPRDGWLVVVPAAMVLLAYQAYVRQWRRRESLQLLYEASRVLHASRQLDHALVALLSHVQRVFNVGYAEVLLLLDDEPPLRTCVDAKGRGEVMEALADPCEAAVARRLGGGDGAATVQPDDAQPLLAQWLAARGLQTAVAAPLRSETGTLGVLVVGDRLREPKSFGGEEVKVFGMLASHAGTVLANGQLERSVAELVAAQDELRRQAFHDPLTGLANRAQFEHRLEVAMRGEHGLPVAVMFIDLDDFKGVNDTLGHEAGDALLCAAAERLRRCLRPSDVPARLGGDEFAVLLESGPLLDEALVAERVVTALCRPYGVNGRRARVGASVGVAVGQPGEIDAAELVRRADAAMYEAKRGGKNRFALFGQPLPERPVIALDIARADDGL